jgi:hypothetical protein
MEEAGSGKNEFLENLASVLIAIVVVIGAVVAWRASVIDDGAGDADYAGLRAAIYAQKTTSLNTVDAYEAAGNYVNYWRNSRLGEAIGAELETAPEDQATVLEAQLKNANDLADANRGMFETRYLNRDGTYSVQRQMGEMWAAASRRTDMNYMAQFDEANRGRSRSLRMLLAVMVLSIAPIFYSLVESVADRAKVLMIGFGSLFAVGGLVLAILVQLGKL